MSEYKAHIADRLQEAIALVGTARGTAWAMEVEGIGTPETGHMRQTLEIALGRLNEIHGELDPAPSTTEEESQQ